MWGGIGFETQLVARIAGRYQISATLFWEVAGVTPGTFREAIIRLNGTTFLANVLDEPKPAPGPSAEQTLTTLWEMSVGDFVELVVDHDASVSVDILKAGAASPEFMMVRV